MAAIDDLDERKPVADSACKSTTKYNLVPVDTGRHQTHELCPNCFPDDEVDQNIGWLLASRWGDHLHKGTEDGNAVYEANSTEHKILADKLADPDVSSPSDIDWGDDE